MVKNITRTLKTTEIMSKKIAYKDGNGHACSVYCWPS